MVRFSELKVADLRRELDERGADSSGLKAVLQDRLRQIMIEEGEDPDTFEFESPEFEWAKKLESKIEASSKQSESVLKMEITALKKDFEERIGTRIDILESKMEEQKEDLRDNIRRLDAEMDKLRMELQAASLTTPSDLKVGDSCRPRLKPPQYDGKTSWENYLLQFEAAANANGCLPGEKATALTLALRGEATDVLQTLSPAERGDYDQLVRHLEMRFGQARFGHVFHAQQKNRSQRPNETLQEFEADIARLVRLAYPTAPQDLMERLAVEAFVGGLHNAEMRQAVALAHPERLEDALARALEFEAVKKAYQCQARVRECEGRTDVAALVEELRRVISESRPKKDSSFFRC